jgi:hypothetical protein
MDPLTRTYHFEKQTRFNMGKRNHGQVTDLFIYNPVATKIWSRIDITISN